MPKRLLRTSEGFARLGIKNTTGFALLKSGQLRSVKIGNRRLIPEDAIDEFIEALEAQGHPQDAA